MKTAVEFNNITKKFGSVLANNNISFKINYGEILALLGENGSGKTTLMNMLAGIYYPDAGQILINGGEAKIVSPRDAFNYKIGMIHQHFKLIEVFTAAENIVLGVNEGFVINQKEINNKIQKLIDKYGFEIDINKKIYDMSVSEKQTVEIIKALYRGSNILILDEPTAVLTPQETQRLFNVLINMKKDGKAIIIITHKMQEVLSLSDKVAVLRKGEYVGLVETSNATTAYLTELMVGAKVELNIKRSIPQNRQLSIRIKKLTVKNEYNVKALDNISFDIFSGEILGIAGIAGSGQKELLESIAGLQKVEEGSSILFYDGTKEEELIGKSPLKIKQLGVSLAFVPEDRLGMGLVGNMGMTDNMLIRLYGNGISPFLNYKQPTNLAKSIKEKLEVLTPSIETPVSKLSGGNVQKVLVGREIASSPKVLMTAYAVRGLDINTSYTIYNILNEEKEKGSAVVYVGEDIDVLLALSDRILVLCGGRVSKILDARKASKQEIGVYMTNVDDEVKDNEEK